MAGLRQSQLEYGLSAGLGKKRVSDVVSETLSLHDFDVPGDKHRCFAEAVMCGLAARNHPVDKHFRELGLGMTESAELLVPELRNRAGLMIPTFDAEVSAFVSFAVRFSVMLRSDVIAFGNICWLSL